MGTAPKEKKSFKKFASKHLATVIENRRKGRIVKREKLERIEAKKKREENRARKEEAEHQAQLERLKEQDPAFYSYLEEEDPGLLQFGQEEVDPIEDMEGSDAETDVDENEEGAQHEEGDDEDDEDDDEGEAGGDEDSARVKAHTKAAGGRISKAELKAALDTKKFPLAVDMLVSAVRELGYTVREKATQATQRKFSDPAVVKEVAVAVPRALGAALGTLLGKKDGSTTFKSHSARQVVKRTLYSMLATLSEGNNDGVLAAALLQSLTTFVPVLHLIKGVTKQVLKTSLSLCTHEEESVRVAAYVVVRAMATRAAGTHSMYQSAALKGIFVTLVRACSTYNSRNINLVAFLMNCVVDLYGTDIDAAYQHAFVYIRQLAIYLRAALQQQSQGNIRAVFNWQYLLALRTWGLVVSTYAEPNQLGPLIHPVVQIAVGVMDLFCSPRMFPMHLHVIEMINHIAARASVYVPVSTYLLRILTSSSIALDHTAKKRDAADASGEQVDLQFTLRIKKAQVKSQQYKTQMWSESLYLLTEHLAQHSHSIGAPEAFWAVASTLRKMKKDIKLPRINAQITTILKHLETGNKAIVTKRDQANFGPSDAVAVQQFEQDMKKHGTPLSSYYNSLRQQRIASFAAKQKNTEERTTLDDVSDARKKRVRKQ